VGFQTNFKITAGYFFQLPQLAPNEIITGADLTIGRLPDPSTGLAPAHDADLVAVGFTNVSPPANTAAESQAYYYVGEGALDTTLGRMLIQDDFLVPGDYIAATGAPATTSTSDAGDTALLAYINSLYANPEFIPGTGSLILRINPEVDASSGTVRYTVSTAETTLAGSTLPTLTLTTQLVPEPGMVSMLVILGAGLVGRRRRI
jgi:hypothetical protein